MNLDLSNSFLEANLNTNNIMFYDSDKQIHEVHTLKAEHYVFIVIASFMILSLICGTIYEIYK